MIDHVQPWAMRADAVLKKPTVGPNEQQLLKDSSSLTFRLKAALTSELIEINSRSHTAKDISLKVTNLFQKQHTAPIPGNMQEMVPGLIRGEQPSEQGFQYLAKRGVKTVINLTEESDLDAKWAPKLDMKEIHIPEDGSAAPTLQQTRAFLRAATDSSNGPIFFHCYHGSDRTGTMAACYRIAVQGWSADQAIAELGPHGFNTAGELAKLQFIKDFAGQWRGKAAEFLASGP